MKTRDLIQEIYFDTTPDELYSCIMDSDKHAAFTQSEAEIDPELNGEFYCYAGYIRGKNIFLEKDLMIIQDWRAEEENWPEDHFSSVQFKFQKAENGTKLTFIQKGIPEAYYEAISSGWYDHYWEPLKKYLN